ncbi:hypothetical protein SAMN05216259_1282 [Actinacidiphila guanduensis]|uniref:Uncharacterized protein n=1 Tax=Actinacidiphila guanduensis TaxID=310781 RepID=A0A1H0SFK3_9ACTN|nr:hypothetical protein SAMN05216259_1282 [Actinacidiphila guanduensis]
MSWKQKKGTHSLASGCMEPAGKLRAQQHRQCPICCVAAFGLPGKQSSKLGAQGRHVGGREVSLARVTATSCAACRTAVYGPKARFRRLSKPGGRVVVVLGPQHLYEFGGLAQELSERRLPGGPVVLVVGEGVNRVSGQRRKAVGNGAPPRGEAAGAGDRPEGVAAESGQRDRLAGVQRMRPVDLDEAGLLQPLHGREGQPCSGGGHHRQPLDDQVLMEFCAARYGQQWATPGAERSGTSTSEDGGAAFSSRSSREDAATWFQLRRTTASARWRTARSRRSSSAASEGVRPSVSWCRRPRW